MGSNLTISVLEYAILELSSIKYAASTLAIMGNDGFSNVDIQAKTLNTSASILACALAYFLVPL